MTGVGISTPDETTIFGATGGLEGTEDVSDKRVLSAADKQAMAPLPVGLALLIVQRGPSAGARFLLDTDRIIAGRHPRSDIFLDDVAVLRKHCESLHDGGGYLVCDIRSLNGIYVGCAQVESCLLAAGEEV